VQGVIELTCPSSSAHNIAHFIQKGERHLVLCYTALYPHLLATACTSETEERMWAHHAYIQ
jgi:hypothetical protein